MGTFVRMLLCVIAVIGATACATSSRPATAHIDEDADAKLVSKPYDQKEILDLKKLDAAEKQPEEIQPERYTVNFASGSVALDAKLKKWLRPILINWAAARKNQCPDTVAIIVFRGHSDEELYVDKTDRNDMLALQRAQSVRRFAREVFGDQQDKFDLRVESYGDSMPVAENDTPEHRTENRRVVIEAEICP